MRRTNLPSASNIPGEHSHGRDAERFSDHRLGHAGDFLGDDFTRGLDRDSKDRPNCALIDGEERLPPE